MFPFLYEKQDLVFGQSLIQKSHLASSVRH